MMIKLDGNPYPYVYLFLQQTPHPLLIQPSYRRYPSGLSIKLLCCQGEKTGDPMIPDGDASAGNLLHIYGVGLPKQVRVAEYSL
jgi:hypothetical protein